MPIKYLRDIVSEGLEWYYASQALASRSHKDIDDILPDDPSISPPYPIVLLIARPVDAKAPPSAAAKHRQKSVRKQSLVVIALQNVKADFATRYDVVRPGTGRWSDLSSADEEKMRSILARTRALKVVYHQIADQRAVSFRGSSVSVIEHQHVCSQSDRANESIRHMKALQTLVIHGAITGNEWWICHHPSGCPPLEHLRPRHLVLFGCPTPSISAVHGLPEQTLTCIEEITFVVHPNEKPADRLDFEPSWLSSLARAGHSLVRLNIVFRPYRRSKTWEPMPVSKRIATMFGKGTKQQPLRRRLALNAMLTSLTTAILQLSALCALQVTFVEAGSCPAPLFDLEKRAPPEQIQDAVEDTVWQYLCDRTAQQAHPTATAQQDRTEEIRQFIGPSLPHMDRYQHSIAEDIMSRVGFQSVEKYAKRAVAAGVFLQSEMDQWLAWPRPFEKTGKAKA